MSDNYIREEKAWSGMCGKQLFFKLISNTVNDRETVGVFYDRATAEYLMAQLKDIYPNRDYKIQRDYLLTLDKGE